MRSVNRQITIGAMRDMVVPSVLVYAPTTDAAIRSPSAPIAGRIMSDCLNDQGRRSPARLQLGAESSCWFQN
jgi:hypothetical protein